MFTNVFIGKNSMAEHEFVEIPEGFSYFGSDELDPYASEKEKPLHQVFISTFSISKYPTTVEQFVYFLNETAKTNFKASHTISKKSNGVFVPQKGFEDYPATGVSWEMANEYCKWLSEKMRRNVVIPTEAEWEKAARGDDARIWPWGNVFDQSKCNSQKSSNSGLCSVYDYKNGASPYGVMHLSGNVWEWCFDYWSASTHENLLYFNPINMLLGERKVVKGGSAYCTKEIVRIACRDWTNSVNQGGGDDGFRVALRP